MYFDIKTLNSTQATLRKANLSSKLALDNKEKDELLGSRGMQYCKCGCMLSASEVCISKTFLL